MVEFTPPLRRSLCAVAPSRHHLREYRETRRCCANAGMCFTARKLPGPAVSIRTAFNSGRVKMSLGTILIIVVLLMLVGVIPTLPHSASWGYGPSGIVGIILIVLVVLLLMGRL